MVVGEAFFKKKKKITYLSGNISVYLFCMFEEQDGHHSAVESRRSEPSLRLVRLPAMKTAPEI